LAVVLATMIFAAAMCSPHVALDSHHAAFAAGKDKDDKDKDKDKSKDKQKADKAEKEKPEKADKAEKEKSKGKNGKAEGDDASDAGAEPSGESTADAPAADPSHDRVIRSEVVVADATPSLGAFARSRGFRVVRTEELAELGLNIMRLRAPDGLSAVQARMLIAARFPAAVVDFNHLYQPQASLSLPSADYAVQAVHWNPQLRHCGIAMRLGLIDTAVEWSLPILKGARGHAANFLESGIEAAPPQHGTGVATLLIGQGGFGLLPAADLYSAAIFGLDRDGKPVASATSFASALNWLLSQKVATVNVSLSGPPNRLMQLAIERAQQRGLQMVAAVGNDGETDVPRYPAAYPGVIGVTAVDQAGQAFSDANRGSFVTLAAPGVGLLIPGQPGAAGALDRLVTGTSFAVPYVTAALASYGNNPVPMLAAARDLGTPGPDPIFGIGLVQAPSACLETAATN
jgi:hypothetical protein